jgi:hypothetical protein
MVASSRPRCSVDLGGQGVRRERSRARGNPAGLGRDGEARRHRQTEFGSSRRGWRPCRPAGPSGPCLPVGEVVDRYRTGRPRHTQEPPRNQGRTPAPARTSRAAPGRRTPPRGSPRHPAAEPARRRRRCGGRAGSSAPHPGTGPGSNAARSVAHRGPPGAGGTPPSTARGHGSARWGWCPRTTSDRSPPSTAPSRRLGPAPQPRRQTPRYAVTGPGRAGCGPWASPRGLDQHMPRVGTSVG